jgi:hypothetical protein
MQFSDFASAAKLPTLRGIFANPVFCETKQVPDDVVRTRFPGLNWSLTFRGRNSAGAISSKSDGACNPMLRYGFGRVNRINSAWDNTNGG